MLEAIQLCIHSRHVCDGWVQRTVVLMGKSFTDFDSLQTIQDLVLEGVPGRNHVSIGDDFVGVLGEGARGLFIGETAIGEIAGSDGTYVSVASSCCSGELSKSGGLVPGLASEFSDRGDTTVSKGAFSKHSSFGRLGCRDTNSGVWHVWAVKGSYAIFLDDVADVISSLRTGSEKTGEGETAGEEESLLWRNSDSISRNSPGIDRSTLGETRRDSFFFPALKPREDAKRELLYRTRVIGRVVGVSNKLEEAVADSNFF